MSILGTLAGMALKEGWNAYKEHEKKEKMKENLLIGGLIAGGLALAGLAAVFLSDDNKEKIKALLASAEERENLNLENVEQFFKNSEISQELKSNENLQAAVTKTVTEENKNHIVCCLYDKTEKKVLLENSPILNILTDNIDGSLKEKFGDKDMIILE